MFGASGSQSISRPMNTEKDYGVLTLGANLADWRISNQRSQRRRACGSDVHIGTLRGPYAQECLKIASCASARNFARDELLFICRDNRSGALCSSKRQRETHPAQPWRQRGHYLDERRRRYCRRASRSTDLRSHLLRASHGAMPDFDLGVHPASEPAGESIRSLRKNIHRILANRLQELEERFREVATEKVAKRLALTLFRLLEARRQAGSRGNQGFALTRRTGPDGGHHAVYHQPHSVEVERRGASSGAQRGRCGARR